MEYILKKNFDPIHLDSIKEDLRIAESMQDIIVYDPKDESTQCDFIGKYSTCDELLNLITLGFDTSVLSEVRIDPEYGKLKVIYDKSSNKKQYDLIIRSEDNYKKMTKYIINDMKESDNPKISSLAGFLGALSSWC